MGTTKIRGLIVGLGVVMALALLGSGESGASGAQGLDQLTYSIRTRYDNGLGCANERVTSATIGVPALVDVGGLPLPDLLVELVAVPAIPGVTDTTTVNMIVTKLALGRLPVLFEAVLAPSGQSDPERVAFGYDACASTAPGLFTATVISTPTRLSVEAGTLAPGPNLTVLGSSFRASGTQRLEPTSVAARLSPVPSSVRAVVDEIGDERYHARFTTSSPTTATVNYENRTSTARTLLSTTINQFPGDVAATFGPQEFAYTASAPIHDVAVGLTSTASGEWTERVTARLTDLPVAGSFRMDGDAAARFEAQGRLGEARVRLASYQPGATLPAATVLPHQFVTVERRDTFDVIDLRLQGVARAIARWDDPFAVDIDHTAGPFDLRVRTDDATTRLTARDLPAVVQLTYSPGTQDLTYTGSAEIAELRLDHLSEAPLVETATDLHVTAIGVPIGLTFSFDDDNSTLTASMDGTLGLLEVQLTSGPDERLPAEVNGVKLVHTIESPRYVAFVRLAGIEHTEVAWSDPVRVNLHHGGGPVVVSTFTQNEHNDVSINTKTVDVVIEDLPAVADFTYSPSAQTVTYEGSAEIGRLQADVVNDQDGIADRAKELHLLAEDLPTNLNLALDFGSDDDQSFSVNLPPGQTIGLLELQLTDGADDRLEAGKDGLLFEDLDDRYVLFARAHGLHEFHYRKTISPTAGEGSTTVTSVNSQLLGGRDLRLDLREVDETKPDGVAVFQADYVDPPDSFLLFVRDHVNEEGEDWYSEFVYSAEEQGGSVEIHTNQGENRSFMDATLTPVPTVASVCMSGSFGVCAPEYDRGEQIDDQSYSFLVAEPINLQIIDCKETSSVGDFNQCAGPPLPRPTYGASILRLDLDIERAFTIMTQEHEVTGTNNQFVLMDTRGAELTGSITKHNHSPSNNGFFVVEKLDVDFPSGFRAVNRFVELGCSILEASCFGKDSTGQVACPPGTHFGVHSPIGELDFEDEFCPAAKPAAVDPTSLPQGATDQEMIITGTDFSPGATVRFMRGNVPDDSVTATDVEWLDFNHLRVMVSVASDADTGMRGVLVTNPVDAGSGICNDCFTVT